MTESDPIQSHPSKEACHIHDRLVWARQNKAKQKRAVLTCCNESTALQRCNEARTDTTTCNESCVQAEGIVETIARKDMASWRSWMDASTVVP